VKLVVFGLSLSSSWGNGHATTYRALLRAFAARGHEVVFYEWDAPWYGGVNRDHAEPTYARLILYSDWAAIRGSALADAREADATIVGSYVDQGPRVIDDLVEAGVAPLYFYDIDTPVTVAGLRSGGTPYLRADQVPLFTGYLSFTGGPFLDRVLVGELGARAAVPLYCSVDPEQHRRTEPDPRFEVDLAYMGTYAPDRQPVVQRLLIDVARRVPERTFMVAGPQYPADVEWPKNVSLIAHLPPESHSSFYSSARWQLNATRADMVAAGWSPSVRLFESGAVGAAILSDHWAGIDSFLRPGSEILLPETTDEVVEILTSVTEEERIAIGEAARTRIVREHSSARRAEELEGYLSVTELAAGTASGALLPS
jgi:spore maturation protein CgeB